jgi:hypothetical protein
LSSSIYNESALIKNKQYDDDYLAGEYNEDNNDVVVL